MPTEMSKRRIIPYDQKLKPLARQLRKNMTHAEKKLWQVLRRKQIHGYTFLRQRPIGQYIVNYCSDLMLAVEVDGRSHGGNYEADIRRQRRLESLGGYVLRFNDEDVMKDGGNVRRAIGGWVEKHAPR